MSKTEQYASELTGLLADYLQNENHCQLVAYLLKHSSLPGPRGNLELAEALSRSIAHSKPSAVQSFWNLCLELASMEPARAPVNDPQEFLVFCGTRGLGMIAAGTEGFYDPATQRLHDLARDPRWRVREAVAMALQDLIAVQPVATLQVLGTWIQANDWLAMRAVVAGVAEPRLLRDPSVTVTALELHRQVLAHMIASHIRSEPFKVLRKALGYTLSVVTATLPDAGFAYLRILAASDDKDVLWIVRENLKKSRLTKVFPADVAELKALL